MMTRLDLVLRGLFDNLLWPKTHWPLAVNSQGVSQILVFFSRATFGKILSQLSGTIEFYISDGFALTRHPDFRTSRRIIAGKHIDDYKWDLQTKYGGSASDDLGNLVETYAVELFHISKSFIPRNPYISKDLEDREKTTQMDVKNVISLHYISYKPAAFQETAPPPPPPESPTDTREIHGKK